MRRQFVVVIVALLGALFVSGCADVGGGSGNPVGPSVPQDQPTAVRPLSVNLSNGSPAQDGSTLPFDGSVVVDLQYSLSSADLSGVSLSRIGVSVCVAGPAEGTILFTSCDTNGYQTSGKDTFYVSQSRVNVSQRLGETYRVVYFISTGFHSLTPDRAIPYNSGNYPLADSFDIIKWGQVDVRIVWGP